MQERSERLRIKPMSRSLKALSIRLAQLVDPLFFFVLIVTSEFRSLMLISRNAWVEDSVSYQSSRVEYAGAWLYLVWCLSPSKRVCGSARWRERFSLSYIIDEKQSIASKLTQIISLVYDWINEPNSSDSLLEERIDVAEPHWTKAEEWKAFPAK